MAHTDCAAAAFRVGQAAQVACLAGAASLTGHAAVTLAALKLSDADGSAEERLWALTVEGEIAARLGRTGQAEDAFARARAISPDDSYCSARTQTCCSTAAAARSRHDARGPHAHRPAAVASG